MPKLFITGILLILLLAAAGSSQTAQARYIPWDCSDWQAFAHEDRATAILESLAENRGKTLYCGIDQSDTFAKAETWEAGRDHNERDDTVYYGERGRFRGFIAAQEGWLTDGESGITGQSIAVIFEFPKEPPRRNRRVKRLAIANDPEQFPITAEASCAAELGIVCTGYGGWSTYRNSDWHLLKNAARHNQVGIGGSDTQWDVEWDTQQVYRTNWQGRKPVEGLFARPSAAQWKELVKVKARRVCRDRGYDKAASVAIGPGHNNENGANDGAVYNTGLGLGWFMEDAQHSAPGYGSYYRYHARQSRTWTAICVKKGPRQDR